MSHRLATVGAWALRPVLAGALAAACAAPLLGVDALWLGLAFGLVLLITEVALHLVLRRMGLRPPGTRAGAVVFLAPLPPRSPARRTRRPSPPNGDSPGSGTGSRSSPRVP